MEYPIEVPRVQISYKRLSSSVLPLPLVQEVLRAGSNADCV